MNPYSFGIILSFLLVLCVCDSNNNNNNNNHESISSTMDSNDMAPEFVMKDDDDSTKCTEGDKQEGDDCYKCCGSSNLKCYKGRCSECEDHKGDKCPSTPYETASQISLSIAMGLGIIILLVVLWKMCVTPNHLRYSRRARARMLANANTQRNEDPTRTSSSSIQIRIVTRLQNRPPRYESSYNYNQRIESAKQEAIIDEAPPAYDAVEETVEKGPPPPYTISLDAGTRQGVDNNSFVADDQSFSMTTISGPNTTQNAANNRSATINCETVHI